MKHLLSSGKDKTKQRKKRKNKRLHEPVTNYSKNRDNLLVVRMHPDRITKKVFKMGKPEIRKGVDQ